MVSKKILNNLKDLSSNFDLDLFILFGSRAKNSNKEDSDWDFAILPGKFFNEISYRNFLDKLYILTNSEKVDLINLELEDNPILRNEIFKDGICIYEKKKNLFKINQTNAWFNYLYFKPEIDLRNSQIEESLRGMI